MRRDGVSQHTLTEPLCTGRVGRATPRTEIPYSCRFYRVKPLNIRSHALHPTLRGYQTETRYVDTKLSGHTASIACGAVPPLLRAVLVAAAAAMQSSERPPSPSAALLPWLLTTCHWQFDALHATALRRWANWLHAGDSRHLVMSPSDALAKLLTDDDHWFY